MKERNKFADIGSWSRVLGVVKVEAYAIRIGSSSVMWVMCKAYPLAQPAKFSTAALFAKFGLAISAGCFWYFPLFVDFASISSALF